MGGWIFRKPEVNGRLLPSTLARPSAIRQKKRLCYLSMASRAAHRGRQSSPVTSARTDPLDSAARRAPSPPWSTSPTALDVALAIAYPTILLAGSLYSSISPGMSPTRVSSTAQDGVPVPSYFAHKSNIFNLYFVKIGWAWTTLAFLFFALFQSEAGGLRLPAVTKSLLQAVLRLSFLTLWWVVVSQWCFGPGLVDRSFRLTGGACESEPARTGWPLHYDSLKSLTEAECKSAGGRWRGGHDISGHVFLLTMSSAALLQEYWPARCARISERSKRPPPSTSQSPDTATLRSEQWTLEELLLVAVVILDLWMLLMTSIYFHTLLEKVLCPDIFPVGD